MTHTFRQITGGNVLHMIGWGKRQKATSQITFCADAGSLRFPVSLNHLANLRQRQSSNLSLSTSSNLQLICFPIDRETLWQTVGLGNQRSHHGCCDSISTLCGQRLETFSPFGKSLVQCSSTLCNRHSTWNCLVSVKEYWKTDVFFFCLFYVT